MWTVYVLKLSAPCFHATQVGARVVLCVGCVPSRGCSVDSGVYIGGAAALCTGVSALRHVFNDCFFWQKSNGFNDHDFDGLTAVLSSHTTRGSQLHARTPQNCATPHQASQKFGKQRKALRICRHRGSAKSSRLRHNYIAATVSPDQLIFGCDLVLMKGGMNYLRAML